jgi:hypothetical protein
MGFSLQCTCRMCVFDNKFHASEPGLLEELERRVGLAEAKFMEADLELRLEELEQAKQRQVIMTSFLWPRPSSWRPT